MIGLKVPKKKADTIRRALLKHSLVNLSWKIKRSGDFVFIPITEKPADLSGVPDLSDSEVVETDFEAQKGPQKL